MRARTLSKFDESRSGALGVLDDVRKEDAPFRWRG